MVVRGPDTVDNIVVAQGPVAKDHDVVAQGPDAVGNIMTLGGSAVQTNFVIA